MCQHEVCGLSANHMCPSHVACTLHSLTPPLQPSLHMFRHLTPHTCVSTLTPHTSHAHTSHPSQSHAQPTHSLYIYIHPFPSTPLHTTINRGAMGRCLFLRVEIVNKGATSFVIFSEAANFPLPFRLENFSQVCHVEVVDTSVSVRV